MKDIVRLIQQWLNRLWQSSRSTITSPQARRYRIWVFQGYVLAALLAFAVLAVLANTTITLPYDLHATRELQSDLPGWIGGIMVAISWPGYTLQAVGIVLTTFIILFLLGLRWEAWSALIAALISLSLNTIVKFAVRRPRPTADLVDVFSDLKSYSFPSGHVMFYTAFFGFLLFLIFTLLKKSFLRNFLMFVFLFLVAAVGLSRMYLGEHWASDVIAGYLLGSLCLILTILIYRWGKKKIKIEQPVAPESENDS
jgi:membrane-associated phospholipid phosphatase